MVRTAAPKPRRRELAFSDSRFPYPQVGVTHLKSLIALAFKLTAATIGYSLHSIIGAEGV